MGYRHDAEAFIILQQILEKISLEPTEHKIEKAIYTNDCVPDTRRLYRNELQALRAGSGRVVAETADNALVGPDNPVPDTPRVGRPPKRVLVREIVPTSHYKYIQMDSHSNILNVYTGRHGLKEAGFCYLSLLASTKLGKPYKGFYWRTKKIYEWRMVRKSIPKT